MKKLFLPITILLMSLLLCSCTYQQEVVTKETNALSFDTNITMESEFTEGQTSVSETIPVANEPFSLVCTYDTKDYPLEKWRVTSNKNIYITVNTKDLPEDYSVHIEHVHADIVLKSTSPSLDGITQDSMDDYDHRTPTNGFNITDTITYNNIFSIDGYTDQFYTLWGHAHGVYGGLYGSVSSRYERMTESNIRKAGTYAELLTVVYDLIIVSPEAPQGYVTSVYSDVLIPLVSDIDSITVNGIYECVEEFEAKLEDAPEQSNLISVGSKWTCIDWDAESGYVKLYDGNKYLSISLNTLSSYFVLTESK